MAIAKINFWVRIAAVAALFSVSACSAFYSTEPVYMSTEGIPAYGRDITGLEIVSPAQDQTVQVRSTWRDGAYRHILEERDEKGATKVTAVTEYLVPLPGKPDHFVSQRILPGEQGELQYYYDLVRRTGSTWRLFETECTDLTPEELTKLNFAPAKPPPAAVGAPTTEKPAIDCRVRRRTDLEAAFALIAGRKQPTATLKIIAKGRAP